MNLGTALPALLYPIRVQLTTNSPRFWKRISRSFLSLRHLNLGASRFALLGFILFVCKGEWDLNQLPVVRSTAIAGSSYPRRIRAGGLMSGTVVARKRDSAQILSYRFL